MSNIILPDDPNFDQPVIMGDPFTADPTRDLHKQGITPGTIKQELEKLRQNSPGSFKYAETLVAHAPDPWFKQAQLSGVSNMMTQPMWFSPLHTPQNWQIASKRREVYQWNRFWYENEPKVAAAIDFYARFPMNGFKLECPDPKVLSFFKHHVVDKLKLNERFKEISSEYYMLGDVFIHTDIECELCSGTGVDPDTKEVCDHPGGRFKRIFVMNPDWIEVQKSPLTDEPLIVLIPDEELQQIVQKRSPKPIYDRIPDHLKPMIVAKAPIPLSNRTISHLKHMNVPYGTYGTSIIRRLFTTLAYKTKIMTANWIVAERLILPVRVVKIGSDDRPASTTDIADVQQQLASVANDPNLTIVTHHNFEYDWYGCVSSCPTSSYVITARGRVHHNDLTEDDLIATWNAQTGRVEYQNYIRNIEFEYNEDNSSGIAYSIGNRDWTGTFTPNHRHYLLNGDIKRSDELVEGDEIVNASQWDWRGNTPSLPYKKFEGFSDLTLEEFCRFAGYFVTEGHVKHECSKNLREEVQGQAFSISQNVDADCYEDISSLMFKISSKCYVTKDERRAIPNHQFNIANAPLSRILEDNFGSASTQKHLPSWLLQLPKEYLRILLNTLVSGDGDSKRNRLTTVSERLRDQFMEILIKLGYSPYFMTEKIDTENRNDIFRILWSSHAKPRKFRISQISQVPYNGKMWCLEMPNKNFFIEVDGHVFLTGNTSGKVLQITQEMEHIDKELLDGLMLNQALLNGEMCLPEDHEVLTTEGYKPISKVSKDDSICVWDDTAQAYHYEHPEEVYKYADVADLYEVKSGDKTLFKCTANHKLVVRDRYKEHKLAKAIYSPDLSRHTKITAKEAMERGTCLETLMKNGSYCRITDIRKVSYDANVYCFKTSTGFFVAKYQDVEFVSSNSGYQSAQVGVETLIRRIESWRQTLSEWAEERVFKPIAEMQGFVDEKMSEEVGETVFLHPTIKWNDLELKDKTQYHQMLMQLHDKQVISTQTLLDEIGLNYDQEVKRMRYEQAQLGPQGAMLGQGMGAMGGGAMGGGGAGGAGGMPGGAASPAGGMGMGEGGMPGMGMEPAGAGMAGGAGAAGGMAAAGGTGKITKKGKGSKQEEEAMIPMMPIKLTKIEQKMASMLENVANNMGFSPSEVRMQFPIENPHGGKAFTMDFAIPALKMDIEADGEVWHSSNEQVGDDEERDYLLAQRGWTILRFDDKSIEESTQQVEATINSYIQKAIQARQGKQASVHSLGTAGYFVGRAGHLKDLRGEAAKYYEYLDQLYPSRTKMYETEVILQ
ncbi:MAG: DUF559 domain-containing protein [Promethearchaeota archaeon]|jgi:very-short-patch-repair endonuclease/intein/homing endonuclease